MKKTDEKILTEFVELKRQANELDRNIKKIDGKVREIVKSEGGRVVLKNGVVELKPTNTKMLDVEACINALTKNELLQVVTSIPVKAVDSFPKLSKFVGFKVIDKLYVK